MTTGSADMFSFRFQQLVLSSVSEPQCVCLIIGDVDFHSQQRRRESLSLGISHQRQSAPAAQTFMQKKVQGTKVWQFESFNFALADAREMFLDPLGCHFARQ